MKKIIMLLMLMTFNVYFGYANNSRDYKQVITYYADTDFDGYGDPTNSINATSQPPGYILNGGDCDDTNIAIHPGATEVCNGVDDNCNGLIDLDDPVCSGHGALWAPDADGDTYGFTTSATEIVTCSPPPGYVTWPHFGDCDDNDPNIHPGAQEVCNMIDDDCDGIVDPLEICNGMDDDCNGLIDDNDPSVIGQSLWYADADGDGFGDPLSELFVCFAPQGYLPWPNNMDCDDTNPGIHPNAAEICNGIDDNCDGLIDPEICNEIDDDCDGLVDEGVLLTFYPDYDQDGYSNGVISIVGCTPPMGWGIAGGFGLECFDSDPNASDGCFEICNGIDDDGNGLIDEEDPSTFWAQIPWYADMDGDGYGDPQTFVMAACSPPEGYLPWPNNIDCDDADPEGEIAELWYYDEDGDGFGYFDWWHLPQYLCDSIPGWARNNWDCHPVNALSYPGASEVCNNLDDDCDGFIDDADESVTGQLIWYQDLDHDFFGNPQVSIVTCNQPLGYVGTGTDCNDLNTSINPNATEIADGMDNDCDGLIDEGYAVLSVEAGDCEVVYYGYAPEACQTLTVNADNGTPPYLFSWSNGATTSSTNVCPDETTIYSITVTDSDGQTAVDNVTLQVIDVTCGNNNNKVLVCHIPSGQPENAQVICISPSGIPEHLDHGCYVGICDSPDPCESQQQSLSYPVDLNIVSETIPDHLHQSRNDNEEISFVIMPNPVDGFIEVVTDQPDGVIHVIDIYGRKILSQIISSERNMLQTESIANGYYIVRVDSGTQAYSRSIIVLH